ncbi:MAG: hypothetical protein LBU20_00645 [Candidatus Nomurabacteria bacterium]|jgi:hypothetical protein|nr:hypothetical protein [Candidatus Nomurabacteria bacterium]
MSAKKRSPGKGWLIAGVIMICFGIFEAFGSTLSNMDRPSSDYAAAGSILALIGLLFLAISVVTRLIHRRYGDTDGDNFANDGLSATKTQRTEILEIMQAKGVFWDPKTKITQSEARKIIREHKKVGSKK